MGRLSFLSRRTGSAQNGAGSTVRDDARAAPAPAGPAPAAQRVPVPTRGQLRREHRALVHEREQRIRDLGGLMLEMFRRNQFRQDLLVDRCSELLALEGRLREVETLLVAASSGGGLAVYARCACNAPLLWGSHFCANCGRAVAEAPVVTCARCGSPLAADARFCAACGSAVEAPPAGAGPTAP